jgi:zinc protease
MTNPHIPTPNPHVDIRRTARPHYRRLVAGLWALIFVVGANVASVQTPNWPSERPPRPLPAREVKFPPYETRTLANGLQVMAVLHHEQPVVSMRLLIRAGSAHDPPGRGGLARLAASLLDQGTTTNTAQEIADKIDFIGGALGTGSTSDLTFINVIVMKDSFDVGMDLLADLARHPAFAADEIERQKEQTIASLKVNGNDPNYVATAVFDRLVYGFHPYGLPNAGTPETLGAITRGDLQAYHQRNFVPNNMILAIVGDVTSEEAFAGAERAFGSWRRADVPQVAVADPPQPTRRVIVVDMPDAVQTEIRSGHIAIPRKHQDHLAFDLAVKILGGEGANRLHRVLRSERGLTYGASADTAARKLTGDFVAETDTRTETTGEALRLMIDEISRLLRERVSERELADAQAYLAGSFPLTIETPNDIATQVLNVLFYDLPLDEIGTFRERVQRVTPDDIQRVARMYIRPDRLSIVMVGNAAAFAPQLRAAGFSDFEVIPLDQLDLMSATLKRERPRAVLPVGPVQPASPHYPAYTSSQVNPAAGASQSDAAASALLSRVVAAKGGLDALKKVRTVVAEADTTFHMEQGPLVSRTTTYVAYPDKFRVEATVAGAKVVQVYNAGTAWVEDPGGVHDAPPGMRDDFAASVRRDMMPLLIAAAEGRLRVRQLPDEGADGQALRVLELSGDQLLPVKLYVSPANLIVRQAFSATGPDGRAINAEEVFSDYRRIDGLHVPFKADVRRSGRVILSRALVDVALNRPLDDTLFTRPH